MTTNTRETTAPPTIPRALKARLWRTVVRLPGNPRTGTTFGPGYLSAREAHQWLLDRAAKVLGPTGARKRGQGGRAARWRGRRSHIVLSAETPLLDRGPETRQAIQRAARTRLAARLPSDAGTAETPAEMAAAGLHSMLPGILDPLMELAGPDQGFERMAAADARAIATWTLVGAGERLRAALDRKRPPAPWQTADSDGGWTPATVAAVMDWRDSRGAWPRENDRIGAWFGKRRLRARAAGDHA